MAYTVSKVRNSNPGVLATAATDAETSAQRVDVQIAQGRQAMATLREDWIGTASDAADKQYGELAVRQEAYRDQLRAVKTVLDARGPTLVGHRSDLETAVDDAEGRFDVADDGAVSLGWALRWFVIKNPTQAFKIEAMRIALESQIKLLLAKFEAEDLAAGYEIRQAGRGLT